MRARTFSALCGVMAGLVVCVAGFLSGCASGHKQFAYVTGQGTNEVFEFRVQGNGTLVPLVPLRIFLSDQTPQPSLRIPPATSSI